MLPLDKKDASLLPPLQNFLQYIFCNIVAICMAHIERINAKLPIWSGSMMLSASFW